jgi:integrase/recombinase XerD
MIEDMSVRGFTEKTRSDHVRNVRAFAAFIGRSPDTATAEDLRRFQLHQTGRCERSEVIGGSSLELKVAGPSMLGIGCPGRHALPLTPLH